MSDDRSIQVTDLVREFKGGIRAVDGIDLSVAGGEIYGFLGPNGAGKSTTVKMLTTLLPPSGGTATVAGYDVARQGAKVRACIGVALQDVALDPILTGREHMRLQAGLQGVPRAERVPRGNELLERFGLADAADRKSSTYSGGMKRRLDLALALLHGPRILFLDEPTTGLDVQSRTALWDEVARLAREEGTTVFLTTQYLEEADVLADRVGIIDRGVIVAEGTPAALKAQVSQPTVEVIPRDPEDCAATSAALAPFGEQVAERAAGSIAVRLRSGADQLAEIVRALDVANVAVAHLALHEPTLDDVFLAKTGRSLEGAGDGPAEAPPATEPDAPRAGGRVSALASSNMPAQVGLLAGRAVRHIIRQPAQVVFPIAFPLILLAVNASGLDAATNLPGFPTTSYLDFALAVPFMQGALFAALNGGQDLARDIEGGFLDRLALTPMSGAALIAGQLGGALFMGVISALIYLSVGLLIGVGIATGVGGALVLLALAVTVSFAFACLGTFVALRAGSGQAVQGFFPLFFVALFLSSAFFPRNLIEQDWFREVATYNPVSYLVEGIRSLVITGWDGQALAQAFGIAAVMIAVCLALSAWALRTRLVRT